MWNLILGVTGYIRIPSEEEDKLDQHLTSTKRLLDFGEQNESVLIETTEARGRLLSECYNLHGVLVCTTEQFMVNICFWSFLSTSCRFRSVRVILCNH